MEQSTETQQSHEPLKTPEKVVPVDSKILEGMKEALDIAISYGEQVAPVYKTKDGRLIIVTTGSGPIPNGKSEEPLSKQYYSEIQLVIDITKGAWLVVDGTSSDDPHDEKIRPFSLDKALQIIDEAVKHGHRDHEGTIMPHEYYAHGSRIPGIGYVRRVDLQDYSHNPYSRSSRPAIERVLDWTKRRHEKNTHDSPEIKTSE